VNPTENMWGEVKKTMQEAWPVPPSRNRDAGGPLCQMHMDEVTLCQCTFSS
jgi:hypothetical protein